VAWLLAVLPPVLLTGLLYYYVAKSHPVYALVFNIVVLYLTMGFRQFSHYFTDIQLALRLGELDRARALIAEWRGRTADKLGSSDIARLAVEEALCASYRHVFAVIFFFILLPGPCGVVLYRLS